MKKILFSFLLLCWFVSTGQNFPTNPDPTKCYIKVTSQDLYEYKNVEIVKKPEHKVLSVVPAQYETITKRVLVKPAYTKYVIVPEVWGKESFSFSDRDPASVIEVKPAIFETKTDTIETSPSFSRWEVGGRKPNCFEPDPDACKFWKYKVYPAKYEEYETTYVVQQASFNTMVGNRSNSTYERSVLLQPARVEEVTVPAEYEDVKKKILISDSYVTEEVVPAKTELITKKVLVKKGGEVSWKGVECSLLDYQPLPITWDVNSTVLTDIAKSTIDATLMPVLIYNPGIRLEIASHTDSRGNNSTNKQLSKKRAKAVADYLISKGIQENLLVPVGYGETRLKNDCTDDINCPESKHEENRRTEFRLLE
ncbi:OmpA family protein [Wenyingzhuangia sp. 1_MG-2023]|nr:OmpA family protein [Wenyingzhuangia sp. 1_MG-2023]